MFKQFLSKAILACSLTFGSLGSIILYAQPNLSTKLPVNPKVTTGKLANGLTYYIMPNGKPEKKVELRLILKAGSILENDNQQGLAHFMEHMNFNGTKNFPKNKLVDFLQSIGVKFGADLNAYTGFDQTVYILPIPTDKPGNLESGFQVIEDWAHNANLTDEDINDERKVVLEESRMGKGAQDRMAKKYLPKLLSGSQYANRLPIGKDDILQTFEPNVIRDFYKDWYRPNLMAVAVVGDITVAEAERLIKKHFSDIKNPAKERERKQFEIKPYSGASTMVLTDKEATNYQFQLFFSPQKKKADVTLADYKESIVRNLFTQMLNSRFAELTQSANPPFLQAFSFAESFIGNYESFGLIAIPNKDIKQSVNTAIAELVKVQTFGFQQSELELAKKQMMSMVEKMYNERNTTNSSQLVSEMVENFLTQESMPGIENEYKYYQELLPLISVNEVNKLANTWLNKNNNKNYFSLITGPSSNEIDLPADLELKEWVNQAFDQKVTENAEKVIADKLLEKDPVPGKITAVTEEKNLGATTYTLSNGLKVTVKKTDFKSDEIKLYASKKGGSSKYSVADKSNAKFLPEVIESMGYGNFTPVALKDALSGKNVSLLPTMEEISSGLRGGSSVKDFGVLMELVNLQLTQPRIDEDLYTGFASTMSMQLKYAGQNPTYAFIDTFGKALYNGDARRPIQIPTLQDVENVNMMRVVEIYKNEFSNADGMHFFIVGNVDESNLKPLIEKYIGSLPTTGKTSDYKDIGLRPVTGNNKMVFKKGQDAKSLILTLYRGELPYTDKLSLETEMIGELLSITVIEQVREKMGAMYSGGFNGIFNKQPYSRYNITGQFPCGPENVDAILNEVSEEIEDLKKNGPSQKNLDKVKAAKLEARKDNLKNNDFWTGSLANVLLWGNSEEYFLNMEKYINSVTVTDVKAAANKLLNGKNSFTAILMPEDK